MTSMGANADQVLSHPHVHIHFEADFAFWYTLPHALTLRYIGSILRGLLGRLDRRGLFALAAHDVAFEAFNIVDHKNGAFGDPGDGDKEGAAGVQQLLALAHQDDAVGRSHALGDVDVDGIGEVEFRSHRIIGAKLEPLATLGQDDKGIALSALDRRYIAVKKAAFAVVVGPADTVPANSGNCLGS